MSVPHAIPLTRLGRHVVFGHLASGGMADVFAAVEDGPGGARRLVTVKTVRGELASDDRIIGYFLDEAKLALRCVHPCLPHAYELGVADGTPYLVLEYIAGVTALDLVRAARQRGAALSVPTVVAIGLAVAGALDYLHQLRDLDGAPLGVVHRDVSPANVMIGYDGGVRLLDLGIAKSGLQTTHTVAGAFKGKFSYQAPEQILAPSTVDHRTDIFALGIVLHEMLCARPLFRGADNQETLRRILEAPIPSVTELRSDVPPALAAVIDRALARDLADRYPTAAALAADLEAVAAELGAVPSPRRVGGEVRAVCGEPPALRPPDPEQVADAQLSRVLAELDELDERRPRIESASESDAARLIRLLADADAPPSVSVVIEVGADEVDEYVIEELPAPSEHDFAVGSDCGVTVPRDMPAMPWSMTQPAALMPPDLLPPPLPPPPWRPDPDFDALVAWLAGA